jgi:uncharacterized protein YeaO (DUF488 family)
MRTSYFQHPDITKNPHAISVARYAPRWWGIGRRYISLAPSTGLLRDWKKGSIRTWNGYVLRYKNEVLQPLNAEKIYHDLHDKILCCWCVDQYICHRRLIADWLKEKLGIDIPEL